MYRGVLLVALIAMPTLIECAWPAMPVALQEEAVVAWIAVFVIALWLIGHAASYGWKWSRVVVRDEEKTDRNVWTAASEPFIDFKHGVMMKFANPRNGEVAEIVLNPAWMHLLPGSSTSDLNRRPNETLIPGRAFAKVKTGSEPASLVAIKSCGEVVGFGTRVSFEGSDYLLTAHHVWNRSPRPDVLAKAGKQVDVGEWEEKFACSAATLDFSLVVVPAMVWAKLGVKASKVVPLSTSETVSVYGGANTAEIMAGFGTASPKEECKWKLLHNSPTTCGWSGTPLYSTKGVVGMHLGVEHIGRTNRAVNIGWVLSCLLRSAETLPPELSMLEIDYDDIELRSAIFEEVDIKGKGKVALGPKEFAWKPKSGVYWGDVEDDDEYFQDALLPPGINETTSHLNCQRAAGRNALPPSLSLRVTTSPVSRSSEKKECRFGKSEDRLASLERSLENLQTRVLPLLNESFQSSKILVGLNEVPLPSSPPSGTKQVPSRGAKDPPNSKKPASGCSSYTPGVDPSNVSGGMSGPSTTSIHRRRRRRSHRKSTGTPVPVSPSRA